MSDDRNCIIVRAAAQSPVNSAFNRTMFFLLIFAIFTGCCTDPNPVSGNSRSVSILFKRSDSGQFQKVYCTVWDHTLPESEGGFSGFIEKTGDSLEFLINSARDFSVNVRLYKDSTDLVSFGEFQGLLNPNERNNTKFRYEIFADSVSKSSK